MLQIGSESPRDLYVTDRLAAVLSDARIETLAGQVHGGMTTAPEATKQFLLAGRSRRSGAIEGESAGPRRASPGSLKLGALRLPAECA